MIIWGWSTKSIGEKALAVTCKVCNHNTLSLLAYQVMFDLFWIPTFPLKRKYILGCENCGTSYPMQMLTIDPTSNDDTLSFKTPWWSFSGLLVIAFLVVIGACLGNSEKNKRLYTVDSLKTMGSLQQEKPMIFNDSLSQEKSMVFKDDSETP